MSSRFWADVESFIDANKEDNATYFAHAPRMSRKG